MNKIDTIDPQKINNLDNVIYLKTTTSTNDYIKNLAKNNKISNNTIVIANAQTNGRGRFSKSFFSPEDNGIYLSLYLENLDFDISKITPLVAVCLVNAIKKTTNINPLIKWINDIYLDNRKISGILCEKIYANNKEAIIVGVGINIYKSNVADDICNIYGYICENKVENLRNDIINAFLEIFYHYINTKKDFFNEYKKNCFILSKTITFVKDGETFFGKAIDINDNFNLIVHTSDKIYTLHSGEISIKFTEDI